MVRRVDNNRNSLEKLRAMRRRCQVVTRSYIGSSSVLTSHIGRPQPRPSRPYRTQSAAVTCWTSPSAAHESCRTNLSRRPGRCADECRKAWRRWTQRFWCAQRAVDLSTIGLTPGSANHARRHKRQTARKLWRNGMFRLGEAVLLFLFLLLPMMLLLGAAEGTAGPPDAALLGILAAAIPGVAVALEASES